MANAAGSDDTVSIVDAIPDLEPIYRLADLFLLSSRLDPLPNVAIDAALRGIPVVCFEGATGIADLLAQGHSDQPMRGAPSRRDAAATVIARLVATIAERIEIGRAVQAPRRSDVRHGCVRASTGRARKGRRPDHPAAHRGLCDLAPRSAVRPRRLHSSETSNPDARRGDHRVSDALVRRASGAPSGDELVVPSSLRRLSSPDLRIREPRSVRCRGREPSGTLHSQRPAAGSMVARGDRTRRCRVCRHRAERPPARPLLLSRVGDGPPAQVERQSVTLRPVVDDR